MSFYKIEDSLLSGIADAIRSQTGGISSIAAADFPSEILNISGDNGNFKLEIEAIDYYSLSDTQCSVLKPYCFYMDDKLTEANFDNVVSIRNSAFYHCNNLLSASFPNCETIGEAAFQYCSKLQSFYSPNVTTIGKSAFFSCYSLNNLSFSSMDSIGEQAFRMCSSLTQIEFDYCDEIQSSAFLQDRNLTKVIGPVAIVRKDAFDRCGNLSEFDFTSTTDLGTSAFAETGFTEIELPMLSQFLNSNAFAGCLSLSRVSLPIVEQIGITTFNQCTALTSVYAPNITTILSNAFSNCTVLSDVNVSNASKVEMDAFRDCQSLSEINLQNVYYLSARAFMNCTNLERIIVGNNFSDTTSVNYGDIGVSVFYNCTKLSEVTNLSYGRYIGQAAFYKTLFSELCFLSLRLWSTNGQQFMSCSLLTTVSISGEGISRIYSSAFANCPKLTSLYLLKPTMLALDKSAKQIFNNSPLQPGGLEIEGVTYYGSIYVPEDIYNNYIQNASWGVIETSHPGTFVSIPATPTT